MRSFNYQRPESIAEAIALMDQDGSSRPLAGGTDLLTLMKGEIEAPSRLIDIKRLSDLDDAIVPGNSGGITIGALATLSEIEHHPLIAGSYTALAQSVSVAATTQLRNMATIGGNLLQRPRCWYFRDETIPCWLKGGDTCPAREGENQHHAILGESPCVATHPSDPATALLALDASMTLRGQGGERTIGLDDFFAEPTADRRTETTIRPDEIVTSINLPGIAPNTSTAYLKAMDRKAWSFALVGVAASLTIDGGRITGARIVLGGVATIPWRVQEAEAVLIGQPAAPDVFERAAHAAVTGSRPLTKNGYKIDLLKPLITRALAAASVGES
jgi:xanthine dehydrogenase YagS FAD-binding subunit